MKKQSIDIPLRQIPLTNRFVIPLKQHVGSRGVVCVKPGSYVLRGQPLTFGFDRKLPVHSPTSGKVLTIIPHNVATSSSILSELSVIIEADGKDLWIERNRWNNYRERSRSALIDRIHQFRYSWSWRSNLPN